MSMRELTNTGALAEALREEMARDASVFVIGEDIEIHGGIFGQFIGLSEAFPGRVIDTPISETAIVGAGLGAALTGMRPFVDLHYADFLATAMDEVANQAAKIRYMFGGQAKIPLVIWAPDGAGLSAAAHHSQSLEAWFVHTPGLKVICPCFPHDVKGLAKTAIRDDDPILFFMHKKIFTFKGPVPEGEYLVPLGKADCKREGKDATVITYSRMVLFALEAAEHLAKEGISLEVLDLRTLWPLDWEAIARSVTKTSRVVVAHEACITGGVGAEVAARIQEELFDWLDAPVIRVGAHRVPLPFSPVLERFVVPGVSSIVEAVHRLLGKTGTDGAL
jgi:acetoin:2,6-dichlorophenolindophenol oxidoreductase subunit beta